MSYSQLLRWMSRAAPFTLLVIVLVVWKPGVTSTQGPPTQKNEPSQPVEAKGIIEMIIASAIDAKGKIVNPRFTFPPNEPQITAIVYVGKINASQLKITWYKTSENGDEKLFEHQVQVKSYERAFSVAKNAGGTLELGTYKVVASLEGQTEEVEFDISPPKTEKKTSNSLDEKLFEDQAQSKDTNRAFSIRTNSRVPLTASIDESTGNLAPQMQKVAWNASSVTTQSNTMSSQAAQQGKRPVSGTSGTAPQPPSPSSGPAASGCTLVVGHPGYDNDNGADIVTVVSYAQCASENVTIDIYESVNNGPPKHFQYKAGTSERVFVADDLNPCFSPAHTDLPGTKIAIKGTATDSQGKEITSANTVITLGDDTMSPRVLATFSPASGDTVKAGDKINVKVTAQEKRRNGPWQTGVQEISVEASTVGTPGGLVGKDWVNPSSDPQPCEKKTWEQNYEATYTVPSNPPPTIKICAHARDYVTWNDGYNCVEFYTIPEGKNNVMPANCKRKGYARLGFIDGSPPLGAFDPKDPNYGMVSCNFRWTICGKEYIKTKLVKNAAGACKSFFSAAEASLPKEEYCCDCYPKCSETKPKRAR